jgi:very-short-patch-repair endonuclease
MKQYNNTYDALSDSDKKSIINQWYVKKQLSFADIAKKYNTYSNKIRRDAKRYNIAIRNKSEAQKNALNTGKHKHPTKGKSRSEETKQKIGKQVMKSWDRLDEKELLKRRKRAQENWNNMDINTKEQMQQSAIKAVRASSKYGSKLEKFMHKNLLKHGFVVEFHKEQSLSNTKLQLDLFLPSINTVIEIDGPSHFEPVWGEAALKKNIKYDQKKEGLIIGKGWHLIRIKQLKDFSKARAQSVLDQTLQILKTINAHSVAQKISISDS